MELQAFSDGEIIFDMNKLSNDQDTDEGLFASLPGGRAVIDWFGFCPRFHDASLERVEFSRGEAVIALRTFRMTSETDAKGYYILDQHAVVYLKMYGVTGLKLDGDTVSIIGKLTICRISMTPDRSEWLFCNGPMQGDIRVEFDTSIGLCGVFYAKRLEFDLQPVPTDEAAWDPERA